MLRLVFIFIIAVVLYWALRFLIKDFFATNKKVERRNGPEELVQDPYCHTYIPKASAVKKRISGHLLYFCGRECLENYLKQSESEDVGQKGDEEPTPAEEQIKRGPS